MNIQNSTTGPINIDIDVDAIRRMACSAAEAAVETVVRRSLEALRVGEETFANQQLTFDPTHLGDPPISLDVAAREAVTNVVREQFPLIVSGARYYEAGEEAGTGTVQLRTGDFIIRRDDLDGSTNADCLLDNFSCVVAIDRFRSSSRAKHLAGAIALPSGIIVSWVNTGRWSPELGHYLRNRGHVYISCRPRNIEEFELVDPRSDRRENTYAAVASKPERLQAFMSSVGSTVENAVMYNMAGTPVVAALLAGALSKNIEVSQVTLHDSMHLIPHQLLGGQIRFLGGEEEGDFDYLALYEREAINMNPTAKPVPPYIAIGGLA